MRIITTRDEAEKRLAFLVRTRLSKHHITENVVYRFLKHRSDDWVLSTQRECEGEMYKLKNLYYDLEVFISKDNYGCSCGAKHTGNPNHHLPYCTLFKKD